MLCTSTAFAQQAPAASKTTQSAPTTYPMDSVDTAQASNPFADVPANHWAYDAVRQLAADGYIQGYPDGQYKGQRPMTRYEAAVLTDRAVRSIEAKLAQLQQVEQRDIAAVRALINAFRPELDALKSQVAALQRKTDDQQKSLDALKKEADATQLRVNQGKVGMIFNYRPGTQNTNIQVFAPTGNGGAGAFLAPGGSTAFPNGPITVPGGAGGNGPNFSPTAAAPGVTTVSWNGNALPVGIFAHGTNYMVARPIFAGQLDPRFNYGFRLSAKIFNETGTGLSTTSPSYCTNLTSISCSYSDLTGSQGNIPVNLDYLYIGYTSPGGINARLGRYGVGQSNWITSPAAFLFGGASYSGFAFGYKDTVNRFDSQFYYAIPGTSSYNMAQQQTGLANATIASTPPCTAGVIGFNTGAYQPIYAGLNPNCNTTPSEIGGYASYYFPYSRTAFGTAWDSKIGTSVTTWDPAAVSCGGTLATSAATCVGFPGKTVTPTGGFTGAYLTSQANLATADAFLVQFFGPSARPTSKLTFEYGRNLGSNPYVGGAWVGANSYLGMYTFASGGNLYSNNVPFDGSSQGTKGSKVAEAWFRYFGLNAGAPGTNPDGTYDPLSNAMTGSATNNWSGTMSMGVKLGYWLTNSVHVGAGLFHVQNIPGVTIPAGSVTGASACPGCFVNQFNMNGAYLNTFFLFI